MATKTAKKQTTITSPVIHRVKSRETGTCLGYLVKSNSTDDYYQVTWSYSRHQYECTCQAGQHGKPCCHVAAVQEVVAAKKLLAAPARLAAFFEALASYVEQEETALAIMEAEVLARVEAAEEVPPAPVPTPLEVPAQKSTPVISAKGRAPLGSNKVFSLMR